MNKRVIFKVSLLLIMLFLPSWLNAEELTLFSLKDTADGQDY
nr:flagellar biosynthetic protein FliP [Pseudoalteromonas sp.]